MGDERDKSLKPVILGQPKKKCLWFYPLYPLHPCKSCLVFVLQLSMAKNLSLDPYQILSGFYPVKKLLFSIPENHLTGIWGIKGINL